MSPEELYDPIPHLLQTRGETHGHYSDNARVSRRLKDVVIEEVALRRLRGQDELTSVEREAIDTIMNKIGRIISGQAKFKDHWDDIAGYATLVTQYQLDSHVDAVARRAPDVCPDVDGDIWCKAPPAP